MTNAALATDHPPSTLTSREIDATPRLDLYRIPHKGLRNVLCQLLLAMGRTSFADAREAASVVGALEVVLVQCDRHIHHEDAVIRPALVNRIPRALGKLDSEHEQHATQVAELRAMGKALIDARGDAQRIGIGRTLYLHYSVFVAETLAHMVYEERFVQPLLDRHFTDEEQLGIHHAILKSIAPDEMMEFLRGAIPAISRDERFTILNGGRAGMPAPAFRAVVEELASLLSEADRADLLNRLGL